VHETYLKLRGARVPARDAGHLMGILARAMRQVLVDAARQRVAAKRGGEHAAEPLADDFGIDPPRAEELLDVEHALARLGRLDERLVRVVECRFFVGLTEEETGAALGRSARTVHRDWLRARAWLRRELGRSGPVAAAGGGSREGGAVGPGHGRGGGSA
jgi:RNA polymerase sigma factor (TIGR02999 family)